MPNSLLWTPNEVSTNRLLVHTTPKAHNRPTNSNLKIAPKWRDFFSAGGALWASAASNPSSAIGTAYEQGSFSITYNKLWAGKRHLSNINVQQLTGESINSKPYFALFIFSAPTAPTNVNTIFTAGAAIINPDAISVDVDGSGNIVLKVQGVTITAITVEDWTKVNTLAVTVNSTDVFWALNDKFGKVSQATTLGWFPTIIFNGQNFWTISPVCYTLGIAHVYDEVAARELATNPWQLFAPPRAPMPYTERKPMVSMATTRRVPVAGVSQPLRSVRLNRSHPLFGGLALATSAENWALSDKTRTQLRADASKVDIARGLRFTSTSNNPSDVPLIKVANEKVSVVGYFYVPSATPSGNRVVFRYGHYTSGTDNSGFWLFRPTGGNTLTLGVHNNNTPTYVNLTNVLAGGGAFGFHATYDGSVAYVWVSNLATGAVNSNNTVGGQSMRAPPYGSATLVIGQYSSSSDYVSVATLAVWTGRKVEGAYEFPLWSRNPWALFEGANPSPIHYPTPDRGVKRKLYISSPSVRQPNG